MTLQISESALTIAFATNVSNLTVGGGYGFEITSQYSHQPVFMDAFVTSSNDRYSVVQLTFPVGFGDSHKNGIYNYDITFAGNSILKGLVKIITEPGGDTGMTAYTSNPDTEERVADVYYRPNY